MRQRTACTAMSSTLVKAGKKLAGACLAFRHRAAALGIPAALLSELAGDYVILWKFS